jgi:enamine deaminase RidA (YjgF/YER057c/UK114 family)
MADFVMLNVYVTDMSRMGEVRTVMGRYLTERPLPAISGFEVQALANPDWLVEVDGVAFIADA